MNINTHNSETGKAGVIIVLVVLALMVIGALSGHNTATNSPPASGYSPSVVNAAIKIQGDVCTLKAGGYTASDIYTALAPSVSDTSNLATVISTAYSNCP